MGNDYTSKYQDLLNDGISLEHVEMYAKQQKEKSDNVKRFELLGAEKAMLYARKNADYGDSFNKSLDEDGLLVAKIRLGDKYSRFCQLIKNPAQVTEEKLRETLIDLSNYADMTIMYMDEKEEAEQARKMMEHISNAYSSTPAGSVGVNDCMDATTYGIKYVSGAEVPAGADLDGDIVRITAPHPINIDDILIVRDFVPGGDAIQNPGYVGYNIDDILAKGEKK